MENYVSKLMGNSEQLSLDWDVTITVYKYIENQLALQKQNEALLQVTKDITTELREGGSLQINKSGEALDKLLNWQDFVARRKGRILAFQALYSWDLGNVDISNVLDFAWVEKETLERMGEESLSFTKLLVSGTIEHIEEIDSVIKSHLTNWDFDRLNKVDLAILRISVYPLLFQKDIHSSIIIDEAIDISKEFGSDDSFK